jgi:hypothetical protein
MAPTCRGCLHTMSSRHMPPRVGSCSHRLQFKHRLAGNHDVSDALIRDKDALIPEVRSDRGAMSDKGGSRSKF